MKKFVLPFLLAALFGAVTLFTGATWMAIPTMAVVYIVAAVVIKKLDGSQVEMRQ